MSSPYSVPPRWYPHTEYTPGSLVWYSGCYWRCEQPHQSTQEAGGAPTLNAHLWTPVATTTPPSHLPHQSYSGYNVPPPSYQSQQTQTTQSPPIPPSYGSAQGFNYTLPTPSSTPMHEKDPQASSSEDLHEKYNDDSPSSQATVTEKDQSRGFVSDAAESVADKVNETMRFVVAQKETHDAKREDELKHELKGKRVWTTGGIGIWAFHKDDDHERLKRKVWRDFGEKHGRDEWLKAARIRTEFYNKPSRGVKPLMRWKFVERGGKLPDDALPMGHEADGTILYTARAWYQGGLHLGKAGSHLVNTASISWGGKEHAMDMYEILCGPSDHSILQWRNYSHGENATVDGWQPVEGGREKDGQPLFIAKGDYENGVHPGKCLINDDHACVGWGGGELWVRPFQVLAYSSSRR